MGLSFREVQDWAKGFERERGWDDVSPEEEFILFSGEVGELATALRNVWERTTQLMKKNVNPEEARRRALSECSRDMGEEIADCVIFLFCIANKLKIDLDSSVMAKIAINEKRRWETENMRKTGLR